MFATTKRAAMGVAVLSAGATGAPGNPAEPVAAPEPAEVCVTRGLTRAEVARGARSIVRCAPTREEARAAAVGELAVAAAGAVSAQAAFITAGYFYKSDRLNDVPLEVVGADCGVQVRSLQGEWRDSISGGRLGACSVTKMYKGDNLGEPYTKYVRDPLNPYAKFGLQPDFNNQIRSISFGA